MKLIDCEMLRFFRVDKFLNNTRNLLLHGGTNEICPSVHNVLQRQMISVSGIDGMDLSDEKEKKKKTPRIPKITLINPDESMTVTGLEAAEKIAKRRNFKLIKMPYIDAKSDRDVYKLCNEVEFVNEKRNTFSANAGESKKMKAIKFFPIGSKINDHDLEIKTSNINKLLEKKYRIKLLVSGTAGDKEKLIQSLKKRIKGTLAEEKPKSNDYVLIYHPLLDNISDHPEENIGDKRKL